MKSEAWSIALTGLSLTCVTASALFVLVAVNPKDEVYGAAPLLYAGVAAVGAFVLNRLAAAAAP